MKDAWKLGFSSAINTTSRSWIDGELPEGFSYIELAAGYQPCETADIREKCLRRFQEEYVLADSQKLKVWSLHLPYGPDLDLTVEDDRSQEICENFIGYIAPTLAMGPLYYVVHVFTPEPLLDPNREALLEKSNRNIKRLAEYLAGQGRILAVEALPRTNLGNTAAECLTMISGTKAELCLDVNHLQRESHRMFLAKAHSHVKTLHLSDYNYGDEQHWVPGDGSLDWKEIVALLEQYGYEGPLMFEVKHRRDGGMVSLGDIREGFSRAMAEGEGRKERC